MSPKLYKLNLSPPARASMMACEVFEAPVEMINVDFLKKDHMKPEYIKKNPMHTVPVFEDGDLILHDSHAILMYLADTYGVNDDLYPKDVKQRALVNQILFFDTGVLFPRLREITYPAFMEGKTKVSKMQMDRIEESYGYVEQFLTRSKYIATNKLTIADISVIATLSSMIELFPLNSEKYPKTRAWIDMMEKYDFYQTQNAHYVSEFGSYFRLALEF